MFQTNKCLTCQIAFYMKNIFWLRRRQKWGVLYILGVRTTGKSYLFFSDVLYPLLVLFVYLSHSYASICRRPHFPIEMENAPMTRWININCKFDTAAVGGEVIFKSFPDSRIEMAWKLCTGPMTRQRDVILPRRESRGRRQQQNEHERLVGYWIVNPSSICCPGKYFKLNKRNYQTLLVRSSGQLRSIKLRVYTYGDAKPWKPHAPFR